MEKQKIFWVILSVTVFVVVVLVAGLFLLKSRPDGLAAAAEATPAAGPATGIYEFGRDARSAEGDTEVLRFVIGDGGEEGPADGRQGGAAADAGAEVTTPATAASSAAAEETAPATTAAAVKPAARAATAPAAAKPAATTTKPAGTAAGTTARGPEYWIQTGSYRSQSRAEDLSQSLAAKGLAGRVFSFVTKGETYFRVRIGPYTHRQEADKFLAIVRKIEGLEASYISLVSPSGSAN